MPENLSLTVDGSVAEIVLDRPAKRNALTTDMVTAVAEFVATLPEDVRVIFLRGEGPAFCGGADLRASAASERFHEGLFAMLDGLVNNPPAGGHLRPRTRSGGGDGAPAGQRYRHHVPGCLV